MRNIAIAFLLSTSVLAADENPFAVLERANKAYDTGNYEEATRLYRTVETLIPRSASAKIYVAKSLAKQGRKDEALDLLDEAAAFGARFDESDAAWALLRGDARFDRIVRQMRARTSPLIRSEVAHRLDKELTPENIAYDPKTGAWFVGSMYKAKIIRIERDGRVSDFVPSKRDGLLSVLGMKVDAAKRELWAAAGNFGGRPPIENEDPSTAGQAAIFRYNLDTGALIAKYPAPKSDPPVQYNDIVLSAEGDLYATAGTSGIWRLRRGGQTMEQWFPDPDAWYNGITISPDGKSIFGASHLEGIVKIDLATKTRTLIDMPAGVTLGGIDGLYFHNGSFVGVQNGTDPIRVIRAWVDLEMRRVTRFVVLEQGHPETDLPLTGVIVGNDLYYVGRSQIRAFENGKIWPAERLKETTILRLPLEPAGPAVIDIEQEKASLLGVYRREVRSHLDLDADWLADTTGESFIYTGAGKIGRETPESIRKFFKGYFEGATYLQYDDLEPPVVRVSDDGSMGWVISRVKVRRTQGGQERGFVYAGGMIYEKREGQWVRVANVSTFE